jgi:hypothetical protein
MRLVLGTVVMGWMAGACAHTVSNEERLEGLTDVTVDSVSDAADLRCRDTAPEVQLARDGRQRKVDRLSRYSSAISDAKATAHRFEEAFRKEPDLVYGPKASEWKRRQSGCIELAAILEKEKLHVEVDVEDVEPLKPAPKAMVRAGKDEKPSAAPAKKMETVDDHLKKSTAAVADAAFDDERPKKKRANATSASTSSGSAADDAFGEDTDQLRAQYKRKAKLAKAKTKKKHVSLARRE